MSKLIQALLSGIFFTFILDFAIFLGIFLHYIRALEIELYFNVLFADNQQLLIFTLFSIIIGYLIIYLKSTKIKLTIIISLFIIALSTLIPSIGYNVGENFFMKENITYKDKRHTFIGNVYYDGRKTITFYDYELKRIITLKKKDLLE